MLIVLNGMSSTGQIYITMAASLALNKLSSYIIGGYRVDFSKWPTEAYDTKGKLVYRYHYDDVKGVDDLLTLPNGKFIADTINNFEEEHIINANKVQHLHDSFYDGKSDYGMTPDGFEGSFDDFIKGYKSKKNKFYIVSGLFSKNFIEAIRKTLGSSNVSVYNIMRNPSTAFLFDYEPHVEDKIKAEFGIDDLKISTNLFSSCLSVNTLQQLDYVKTLRYEDIIKEGAIEINGTTIDLTHHIAHNEYFSTYEKDNYMDHVNARKDQLELFNNIFSNIHSHGDYSTLPNNLFDALGYKPLTYDQIFK